MEVKVKVTLSTRAPLFSSFDVNVNDHVKKKKNMHKTARKATENERVPTQPDPTQPDAKILTQPPATP